MIMLISTVGCFFWINHSLYLANEFNMAKEGMQHRALRDGERDREGDNLLLNKLWSEKVHEDKTKRDVKDVLMVCRDGFT